MEYNEEKKQLNDFTALCQRSLYILLKSTKRDRVTVFFMCYCQASVIIHLFSSVVTTVSFQWFIENIFSLYVKRFYPNADIICHL